jgi:hypothetical protein
MGEIRLEAIRFSDQVRREWRDPDMWDKLLRKKPIVSPQTV